MGSARGSPGAPSIKPNPLILWKEVMPFRRIATALWFGWSLASAASGLSFGGPSTILEQNPPPALAGHMDLQSSAHVFFWTERLNVTLTAAEPVNVLPFVNNVSGFYDSGVASVEASWGGILPPGTYNSYFLHADKQGPNVTFEASVTFDHPIEAILYKQSELGDTDTLLGSPTTTYAGGAPSRMLELDGPNNWFEISQDRLTFHFKTVVAHNMDDVRILTAVPEPSTPSLLSLGLLGLGLRNRGSTRL